MKYIYLLKSTETGYCKIGVSKNPSKRIEQLQTGNSSKLKIIYTYQSEYANKIEKSIHRTYNYLKKEGEWFDLSLKEEENFQDLCKKIESDFIFLKKNGNVFI